MKELGSAEFFTYLGWTCNLELNWTAQSETLRKNFRTLTNMIITKKGILTDLKIMLINTVGQTSVLYRAQLVPPKDLEWTEETDRWVGWRLNVLTHTVRNLDKMYWTKFRGLQNLTGKCAAMYIGHIIDNILNSELPKEFVKGSYENNVKITAKQFRYIVANKRKDIIENLNWPEKDKQKWIKCLKNNGIFYSTQLYKNNKWLKNNEIDSQNWNAPGASKKWDNWILNLGKILETSETPSQNNNTLEIEEGYRDEKTYYTDGSLKGNQGAAGFVTGQELKKIRIGPVSGRHDINNIELQAAELTMKEQIKNTEFEIITDSLNTKKFIEKALKISERDIQKMNNRAVKMRIIHLLRAKKQNISVLHIRSHAEDTNRHNHQKRTEQNRINFPDRLETVTEGNRIVDKETGDNRENVIKLQPEDIINRYYLKDENDQIIDENHKKLIYKNHKNRETERWKKNQKRYSQFFDEKVDKISFNSPRKPYGNLKMKIETATIWTNSKKIQLNAHVESPWCENCDEEIEEHHSHVMGGCSIAKKMRESGWNLIKIILQSNRINSTIEPWMTTESKTNHKYDLEEEICNRGMIPRAVRTQITKENPNLTEKDILTAMREIAASFKATNTGIWLHRLKRKNEKSKL